MTNQKLSEEITKLLLSVQELNFKIEALEKIVEAHQTSVSAWKKFEDKWTWGWGLIVAVGAVALYVGDRVVNYLLKS